MTDTAYEVQRKERKIVYWRKLAEPASFWPKSLFYLLPLLLLFLYGWFFIASEIQNDIKEEVSYALTEAEYKEFELEIDGQQVNALVNALSNDESILKLLIEKAHCDTWIAGKLQCPTGVKLTLISPTTPDSSNEVSSLETQGLNTPVPYHNFLFQKKGGVLWITGEVPSAQLKNQVFNIVSHMFTNINEQLNVTNDADSERYIWAVELATQITTLLDSGQIQWDEGVLSITGQVEAGNEAKIRTLFEHTENRSYLGALDLQILEELDSCNDEFRTLLQKSTIRFKTSSAEISPESTELLERLAGVAKSCDMELDIEGHTDSVGDDELNKSLSLARAQAVINVLGQMGVDINTLTPYGYGSANSIADNTTVEGREKNRRIEIKVSDRTMQ